MANNNTSTHTKYLPFELQLQILHRLPAIDLMRYRCICRSWCNLIDCNKFGQSHLHKYVNKNKDNSIIIYSYDNGYATKLFYYNNDFHFNLKFKDHIFRENLIGSCNGLLCF